jgi:hypothetical protein
MYLSARSSGKPIGPDVAGCRQTTKLTEARRTVSAWQESEGGPGANVSRPAETLWSPNQAPRGPARRWEVNSGRLCSRLDSMRSPGGESPGRGDGGLLTDVVLLRPSVGR